MTQKDKQLLLKDLCARLPYKFKVHRYSDNVDISIDDIDDFAHFLEYSEGEDFKPYLRPLSSMSSEEEDEYDNLLMTINDGCENTDNMPYSCMKYVDWLISHNFDYRGLIPMGLALEAKEGMYKTE